MMKTNTQMRKEKPLQDAKMPHVFVFKLILTWSQVQILI